MYRVPASISPVCQRNGSWSSLHAAQIFRQPAKIAMHLLPSSMQLTRRWLRIRTFSSSTVLPHSLGQNRAGGGFERDSRDDRHQYRGSLNVAVEERFTIRPQSSRLNLARTPWRSSELAPLASSLPRCLTSSVPRSLCTPGSVLSCPPMIRILPRRFSHIWPPRDHFRSRAGS